MNPPVSIILVGGGAVARLFYQPALLELARHGLARTVAVVDPSPPARTALAAALHASPHATLDAALAGEGELVVIATPPNLHREQTEAAFAAGRDVLCEKPLASRSADGVAMVEAAARTGRMLAAGHYKRFFPAHRALKQLIEQRTFGALRTVDIAEGGKFNWPAATDSFFRKEQTAGGVLLDIGVHVFDLLLWWLGAPEEFSYADDAAGGLEANCRFRGRFAHDVGVTVQLSRDWVTPNCYVFRFERATVHCRVNASNQLELTLDGLALTFAATLHEPLPPTPGPLSAPLETNPQAFIAQLFDVCSAVRSRRAPFVSGGEAVHGIRLIEQCYNARQPLLQPWLAPLS